MFLVVVLPIICVTGVSPLPYNIRLPLIYAVGIFFLFIFVFSDIKIKFNAVSFILFLLLSYIGISIIYSYDQQAAFSALCLRFYPDIY